MRIAVFGMGYVGLVTAVFFAERGHQVIGIDINEKRILDLQKGVLPLAEPELGDFLKKNLQKEQIRFTSDATGSVRDSELLFICVGTPSAANGSADMSGLWSLADTIGLNLNSYKTIVVKSTVPMGTCDELQKRLSAIIKSSKFKYELDVVSNPEFLREGFAWQDSMSPSRIVIGSGSQRATEILKELYFSSNKNSLVLVMDRRSSEFTKYASNAMLASKISLMNEFARLCEVTGADIESIRAGVGSDPRIGSEFLKAGVGYGGSCLPKDVRALISMGREFGQPLEILEKVSKINSRQKERFFTFIKAQSGGLQSKRIGIWGTAFKPNCDDIRESPAVEFIEFAFRSGASVTIYDPLAMSNTQRHFEDHFPDFAPRLRLAGSPEDAVKDADLLVIFTESECFTQFDLQKIKPIMKNCIIFDGRNIYQPSKTRDSGIKYFGIGRGGATVEA